MKLKLQACCLVFFLMILFSCNQQKNNREPVFNPHPTGAYLTPEESMKTIYLPKGYHIELVASEPMIKEPVAIAWDGNGRMYVAEMASYMQDADATGEQQPVSRIMRLEDIDNDGRMDKATVFADSLLLPRMMQCVGEELLVNETNSITIYSYKDTDGDGIADMKNVVYQNDKYIPGNANMEHQRSGLDWNIDNWMYVTYDPVRFRYTNGIMKVDTLVRGTNGQWGVTHDNYGRLFFSNAGAEEPAVGIQINPVYGRLDFPDQITDEFQEVWPIIATPDVAGDHRLRPNNTLNHFTASCGQSIYRGDQFPEDFVGDCIICEPVGRLVRRAKVANIKGKIVLSSAYDKKEFIASSDLNFRPVNSAVGPDGNLYIVDMYRGIIQQATWIRPGSFRRRKIDSLGLAQNKGRGRIYRVVPDGYQQGVKPKMLNESSTILVRYLNHPNGWWRDNAQKEIINNGDKSVVPALRLMISGKTVNVGEIVSPLGKIHALWTLEGLDAIDKEVLLLALNDQDPQVRRTAVWISEPFLKKNDSVIIHEVARLKNDPSYDVRVQVMLSMYQSQSQKAQSVVKEISELNPDSEILTTITNMLKKNEMEGALTGKLGNMSQADKQLILRGASIFNSFCSTCHGVDGKGIATGNDIATTPSLVGSERLGYTRKDASIRILLHGMTGPINGKSYSGEMPSMANNDDHWIASVLSYVRFQFGQTNHSKGYSPIVKPGEVKAIRKEDEGRKTPMTWRELSDKTD
ncbi:MAG: c-type cytochrome [Chitinophagaceae bacterium]|nr:c-type cytochrome [Chitinophagaceae bacterium]